MKLTPAEEQELKAVFKEWHESRPCKNRDGLFYTDGKTIWQGKTALLWPTGGSGGLQIDSKAPLKLLLLLAQAGLHYDKVYFHAQS